MNQGRRLRASLLAFSLGSAAVATACGDSQGNAAQEAELEDAGPLAPEDASGAAPPPDPKGDAGEEQPEPEPALKGTLAIVEADTVLFGEDSGTPRVGLDVVVNRADGSLAFHGKTGADGRLEVRVPENGSVSLLNTDHRRDESSSEILTERDVRTWFAPPDGYVIRRRDVTPAPRVSAKPNAPMKLVFSPITNENAPAETSLVQVVLPCDGTAMNLNSAREIAEYTGCAGSDTYDVIAFAKNAAGEHLGYALLLNQPLRPGETVTHALKPTQTAFAETITTLTQIPQGAVNLNVEFYGLSSTRAHFAPTHSYYWPAPGEMRSAVLRIPAGIASRFSARESLRINGAVTESFQRDRTGGSPPASASVSLSSLARVTSVDPTDLSMLSRPSLSFSLEGTGSREGCVQTVLPWWDSASVGTYWFSFQAAGTASSARFPALPETLAEYAPQTGGSMEEANISHRHIVGRKDLAACEPAQLGDEVLIWSSYR